MQAVIQLIDDGKIVVEQKTDAIAPLTYRSPRVFEIPCMVGDKQTGTYEIYGFTFQPILRLRGKIGGY
jgi:hypothetical protein